MQIKRAALILSQLGNETRLKIVRHLVKAGEDGVPVGDLQTHLGVPGSTLSHHLGHLKQASLIEQRREGTTLYCVMNYEVMESVIGFLTDECCINARGSRAA
ncbi:MAG TPA: metalloregulator ArsR/SmtB family transcription factor [Arenicellales bacterium]|nr:metalloregulator ArsR/SmtB family transcription factor [Arenicellales bacterium]